MDTETSRPCLHYEIFSTDVLSCVLKTNFFYKIPPFRWKDKKLNKRSNYINKTRQCKPNVVKLICSHRFCCCLWCVIITQNNSERAPITCFTCAHWHTVQVFVVKTAQEKKRNKNLLFKTSAFNRARIKCFHYLLHQTLQASARLCNAINLPEEETWRRSTCKSTHTAALHSKSVL